MADEQHIGPTSIFHHHLKNAPQCHREGCGRADRDASRWGAALGGPRSRPSAVKAGSGQDPHGHFNIHPPRFLPHMIFPQDRQALESFQKTPYYIIGPGGGRDLITHDPRRYVTQMYQLCLGYPFGRDQASTYTYLQAHSLSASWRSGASWASFIESAPVSHQFVIQMCRLFLGYPFETGQTSASITRPAWRFGACLDSFT